MMLTEKEVREFLIKKFEELIQSKDKARVAKEIDSYCTKIVQYDGDLKLSGSMQEIVLGCLDMWHWGDEKALRPHFDENDIEKILRYLKRGKIE
jgi:hypothetical protein